MTTFAEPPNAGLPEDDLFDIFSFSQEMTTDPLLLLPPDDPRSYLSHQWPVEAQSYQTDAYSNDVDPSRDPRGLQYPVDSTAASSSRSPGSLVLTPVSTVQEDLFPGNGSIASDGHRQDSNNTLVSPTSNISPLSDESVYLRHMGGVDSHSMDSHHPYNSQRQLPSSSAQDSVPQSLRQSRASSLAPSDIASQHYWPSFTASTATSGAWINEQPLDLSQYYDNPSDTFVLPDQNVATTTFSAAQLAALGSMGEQPPNAYHLQSLFRPISNEEMLQLSQNSIPFQSSYEPLQHAPPQPPALQSPTPRHIPLPAAHHTPMQAVQESDSTFGGQYAPVPTPTIAPKPPSEQATSTSSSLPHRRRNVRKLPSAQGRKVPFGPQPPPAQMPAASPAARPSRGGRQKESHLPNDRRLVVSRMRKTGACWRCVLQRDPCPDEGTPCSRCLNRHQRGPLSFFPCDRTKLPDLILDFLPPSMTFRHSKQSVEDAIQNEVRHWDTTNAIDVYFTCGYGPPLKWRLYEFKPQNNGLLGQLHWLQSIPGKSVSHRKYSPPFGLLKLDTSDDSHFEEYLDSLMTTQLLNEFAYTCFEEESAHDEFQAQLLAWMCQLYRDFEHEPDLGKLLRKIIRMMLITFIMGHTLTIVDGTLDDVMASIRHSPKGPAGERTSCRLANRQLKFFFSMIRDNLYRDILNWLQQTLHSSGRKEATWLSSFCVMLGISMVLEEIQRLIFLQGDAKFVTGEMGYEAAQREATNACERVDARHHLLVGLFQYKYRDKKWKGGSFGNGTPRLRNDKEHDYVNVLHQLLVQKQAHLQSRETVALHTDNQCLLTTRLVARFMLPFVRDPGGRATA